MFLLLVCKTFKINLFGSFIVLLHGLFLSGCFILFQLCKAEQPPCKAVKKCFSPSVTFVLMNGPGLERLRDIANHRGHFQASLSISHHLKSWPYTVCLGVIKLSSSVPPRGRHGAAALTLKFQPTGTVNTLQDHHQVQECPVLAVCVCLSLLLHHFFSSSQ